MQNILPNKLNFQNEYNGIWTPFFEAVYSIFDRDFIQNKPFYNNQRLALKRYPEYDGKSATFWHLISEGKNGEENRLPCIKRCERIPWPHPIISNSNNSDLLIWSERRKGEERIHIWFEAKGYLVVLNKRKDYILLWTAYPVEYEHQKEKLKRRYQRHMV